MKGSIGCLQWEELRQSPRQGQEDRNREEKCLGAKDGEKCWGNVLCDLNSLWWVGDWSRPWHFPFSSSNNGVLTGQLDTNFCAWESTYCCTLTLPNKKYDWLGMMRTGEGGHSERGHRPRYCPWHFICAGYHLWHFLYLMCVTHTSLLFNQISFIILNPVFKHSTITILSIKAMLCYLYWGLYWPIARTHIHIQYLYSHFWWINSCKFTNQPKWMFATSISFPRQQSSCRALEINYAIQSRVLSLVAHRSAARPDQSFLITSVRVYHRHIHSVKVFGSVEDVRSFVFVPGERLSIYIHKHCWFDLD